MQSPSVDIPGFLNARALSPYQRIIIGLCFLILLVDGFDTAAIGFLAPAIREEWRLSASALAPLFASGLSGLVVGAFLFGTLADRIGRKSVLILCLLLFGLAGLCCAQASSLGELVFFRFVSGIGFGGALPNAVTLTSEYTPLRRRGFLVTGMNCGFTIGSALGGVVSAHMAGSFGWRGVLLLGGVVPLALIPLLMWQLPESLQFLVARESSALRVMPLLRRIAPGEALDHVQLIPAERAARPSVSRLFAPEVRRATLLLWIAFVASMMAIYLLSSWLPTLIRNTGASLQTASLVTAMFQTGGTAGALALGAAMDRFRPQRVLSLAYALAAGFIVLIGVLIPQPLWSALAVFGAGFCLSGGQTAANSFSARLYPTDCRSTGVGCASSLGRMGSVAGSLAGAFMLELPLPVFFLAIALPVALAASCFSGLRLVAPVE